VVTNDGGPVAVVTRSHRAILGVATSLVTHVGPAQW
jgi:hypothetical protein